MIQKLNLNEIQKAIFERLCRNELYIDIAKELNMSVMDVECKVKSVFCIAYNENIASQLAQKINLSKNFN